VAFAALVGLDGSAGWRVARVSVVIALTALAAWFAVLAGRPGRGVAAVVAGTAGTVAGAGVASGHLAKAGLDAVAVLALIVLVAGVIVLGWGTVLLVRATPGWWRPLAVSAAVAVLWFMLFPLTVAVNATNRLAGPRPVRVWVVPQAGHTAALATQPQAWEARVTGFLNAALNLSR